MKAIEKINQIAELNQQKEDLSSLLQGLQSASDPDINATQEIKNTQKEIQEIDCKLKLLEDVPETSTFTRQKNTLFKNNALFADLYSSPNDGNCLYDAVAKGLKQLSGLKMAATELKSKVIDFGQNYAPLDYSYEIKERDADGIPAQDNKTVSKKEYFDHHAKDKEFGDDTMIAVIAQYFGINICVINQIAYPQYYQVNTNQDTIWLYNAANHFECISHLHDQETLKQHQNSNNDSSNIWSKEHQYKWNNNTTHFIQAEKYYNQGKYDNACSDFLLADQNNDITAIRIIQCYAQILANFTQENLKKTSDESTHKNKWGEFQNEINTILETLENEMTKIIGHSEQIEID